MKVTGISKMAGTIEEMDPLWKTDDSTVARRHEHLGKYSELIRFNHGRGMSRRTLVGKFGEEAVFIAIGTGVSMEEVVKCPEPETSSRRKK